MLMCFLAVQGIGAGGIVGLSSIILSDLVPLSERGIYQALLTLVWAFAAAIGPLIVRILPASTHTATSSSSYREAPSPKK